MKKINIVIADDDEIFSASVRDFITENYEGFCNFYFATTKENAIKIIYELRQLDIFICDVCFDKLDKKFPFQTNLSELMAKAMMRHENCVGILTSGFKEAQSAWRNFHYVRNKLGSKAKFCRKSALFDSLNSVVDEALKKRLQK